MMDICGCVFPGRRQIAGVRECECGCKGVWLGSCLGRCWVNYKVAAVWGCTLSSPFSWPAGLLAGLIVVRLLGKEIDALCQGADNIVLDFTVLVKLTGGRGTGEVLFFFSPWPCGSFGSVRPCWQSLSLEVRERESWHQVSEMTEGCFLWPYLGLQLTNAPPLKGLHEDLFKCLSWFIVYAQPHWPKMWKEVLMSFFNPGEEQGKLSGQRAQSVS